MATVREKNFDTVVVPGAEKAEKYLDTKLSHIPGHNWDHGIKVPGATELRPAGQVLGYIDYNVNVGFAKLSAKVDGLVAALAAANRGEPFDQEKLLADIEAASSAGAEAGVTAAFDSITRQETTTVTIKEATP